MSISKLMQQCIDGSGGLIGRNLLPGSQLVQIEDMQDQFHLDSCDSMLS